MSRIDEPSQGHLTGYPAVQAYLRQHSLANAVRDFVADPSNANKIQVFSQAMVRRWRPLSK
jgi:hypothetical protein